MNHDAEPGLTRPYVLTGGRTRGAAELPLEAVVVTERTSLPIGASPEVVAIVELCRTPHSIVEIATYLHLHVGVVRVLVGDLTDERVLAVGVTASGRLDERVRLLERLLDGVRAL
ncbi:MAG: DUF742 domain-containing protein [Acidimicrobiia bacterium]